MSRCRANTLFQLTTSRRGRLLQSHFFLPSFHFNSRPHEEVDFMSENAPRAVSISTHDLTKRSTLIKTYSDSQQIFQLTTSRRGRLSRICQKIRILYFNSRPHEEVDQRTMRGKWWKKHFNSRPHEEVDIY